MEYKMKLLLCFSLFLFSCSAQKRLGDYNTLDNVVGLQYRRPKEVIYLANGVKLRKMVEILKAARRNPSVFIVTSNIIVQTSNGKKLEIGRAGRFLVINGISFQLRKRASSELDTILKTH